MIKKLPLLFVFAIAGSIAGCSIGKVPTDHLVLLSNGDLCRALGENPDNGEITIRIQNEIASREGSIDMEECHSIEVFTQNRMNSALMDPWHRGIVSSK
ncbi:hypothetical protein [Xenorhabdus littoralis]|uniref:hypothetical protein n=1 Tax=Xenorhabdus littoralis TaxID=2582835 RepID=UPI0029E7EAAC|nr:hypothetical protein [Xenorhabdus sp. psl]MDX7992398.1 hypothetical protein [Xenorhabdus sp. psl]